MLRRFLLAALGLLATLGLPAWSQVPAAPAAEYRLGAGDALRVIVFQNPDLSLETRLPESGIVNYPLLGNIRLGGLTVNAAEKLIADGLRNGNFVRQPQVSIALLQVRGSQVSVLGHVNRPGRYPIELAETRLSDMLATAGGAAIGGADQVVLVGQRDGKPFRLEVDLPALFTAAGREKDVLVMNGDTLWVDRQPIVYIYGEVQRPGPMRLEREMTLLQALATGGGLTMRGTERGIRVHRREPDGSTTVLTPAMTDKLREGDVVYVRESLF
ncbi:MAG: polysaccharide export protein EpsE [Rubrivivax sp.]|nr:polysaccharide export protein EpsE [Rubrivivax sp.]